MMVEFPYQAVPSNNERIGLGRLEVVIGIGFILGLSIIALTICKKLLKRYSRQEYEYESKLYPPVDSHAERESKEQEFY